HGDAVRLRVDAEDRTHYARATDGRGDPVTALLQEPIFLLLATTFGVGVFLLSCGPVLSRRRPDLVTRLRRLDPDVWVEEDERNGGAVFGLLGEDLSQAATRIVGRLGLISPNDLKGLLAQADLGLTVREFYQDKVLTALGLESVLVVANLAFDRLGLLHVGVWPFWLWMGVGVVGFVWPDVVIRRGASERQRRLRSELPRLVDLLVVASSTGRGVQDAVLDVEPLLTGPLAGEWSRMTSQLSLGLAQPLRDLAVRTGVREIEVL